ncbi:hypothetical protein EA187_07140 [Lujinxingia sediminis]|uniref:Uncharacterized protein n=1 Tax=Lujinxingia sediminis TaxID=2480984 RepID=A0ABY0CV04_9DELT|nr:hypothetical protein [Lujinxingia sediminis]RVU46902.1 hypothetical protein EA187_07140 [Lujinxingia sediminis]
MLSTRRLAISLLALPLIVACSEANEDPEHITFENEGTVCLHLADDPQDYSERQIPSLSVTLPVCLSSSCSKAPQASCQASVEGTTITLTSSASYLDTSTAGGACTDDCGQLQATCAIPALEPGEYTINHGDESFTLQVDAAQTPTVCHGEQRF